MVWALLIPAVAAVVSAGMQWMNSNEASKATSAERAKIKGMLDKIQDPNFDVSMIMPEDLQLVGKYIPKAIPLIQEAAPQIIKAQSQGQTVGRDAQMSTLQNLLGMARTGRDPITEMQQAQAARQASAEASSARQTATMEGQRRGFGYSPLMQAGAGQDAMQRMALSGQQAAADAYGRRSGAASQASALGGQMFNQDTDIESQNVNIANAFNQRIAQNAQNIAQLNTGELNNANKMNLGEAQRVSDANKIARYGARVQNQNLRNTTAQNQYNNATGKVGIYSGQADAAQKAATDQARQSNETLQALTDLAAKGGMYYDSRTTTDPNKKDPLVRG